jgi:hypothetical protein
MEPPAHDQGNGEANAEQRGQDQAQILAHRAVTVRIDVLGPGVPCPDR